MYVQKRMFTCANAPTVYTCIHNAWKVSIEDAYTILKEEREQIRQPLPSPSTPVSAHFPAENSRRIWRCLDPTCTDSEH